MVTTRPATENRISKKRIIMIVSCGAAPVRLRSVLVCSGLRSRSETKLFQCKNESNMRRRRTFLRRCTVRRRGGDASFSTRSNGAKATSQSTQTRRGPPAAGQRHLHSCPTRLTGLRPGIAYPAGTETLGREIRRLRQRRPREKRTVSMPPCCPRSRRDPRQREASLAQNG